MGTGDQGSESTTGRGPDVESGYEADPGASQGTEKPPTKYKNGILYVLDYATGKYVKA
jgi:hypothetical protein